MSMTESKKRERRLRREEFASGVKRIKQAGYEVKDLGGGYHYRIKKPGRHTILDIWPTSGRFHIVTESPDARGDISIDNPLPVIESIFNEHE